MHVLMVNYCYDADLATPEALLQRYFILRSGVPPRLARWADRVPLDARCGLNVDSRPQGQWTRWSLRWLRWRPNPQRLALGYPNLPLLLAYPRHFWATLRYLTSLA